MGCPRPPHPRALPPLGWVTVGQARVASFSPPPRLYPHGRPLVRLTWPPSSTPPWRRHPLSRPSPGYSGQLAASACPPLLSSGLVSACLTSAALARSPTAHSSTHLSFVGLRKGDFNEIEEPEPERDACEAEQGLLGGAVPPTPVNRHQSPTKPSARLIGTSNNSMIISESGIPDPISVVSRKRFGAIRARYFNSRSQPHFAVRQ
ncbi:hypothetical protein GWK47_014549 [Chionoecetes opilio]|uniref:Uncharacterized protein n=1 Tax=Chionoecetes opilio TaxID=41210 RepID=A0A8J4Y3L6_CHIOP|nr:hypothetical protein GWK47_014549 [Chionoecetes opilio]